MQSYLASVCKGLQVYSLSENPNPLGGCDSKPRGNTFVLCAVNPFPEYVFMRETVEAISTLVMLPSFLSLGIVQTSLASALA